MNPLSFLLRLVCGPILICFKRLKMSQIQRIPGKSIEMAEIVKRGYFGTVRKAKLNGKKFVAVKQLPWGASDRDQKMLLMEGFVQSTLSQDNLVKVLGISIDTCEMMLVLEYIADGSLEDFLRNPDERSLISVSDQFCAAEQVLKALKYLEEKEIVHCNITARSCFILLHPTSSQMRINMVKLGKFNLAMDVASGGHISEHSLKPLAWSAPEALSKDEFSNKSDVWSFGVLLWEIFTLGAEPFGHCQTHYRCRREDEINLYAELFPYDAEADGPKVKAFGHFQHHCPMRCLSINQILDWVCEQRKTLLDLEMEPCCAQIPVEVQRIMEECWMFSPTERPTFRQLKPCLTQAKADLALHLHHKHLHHKPFKACTTNLHLHHKPFKAPEVNADPKVDPGTDLPPLFRSNENTDNEEENEDEEDGVKYQEEKKRSYQETWKEEDILPTESEEDEVEQNEHHE